MAGPETRTAVAMPGARDLPHNLEAEQAVLGAVLIEETAFDQVAALLKPQDFYLLAHQHLYSAFEELAKEAKTIDPVLVLQRLDARHDYFVSLNGDRRSAVGHVLERMEYAHPVFTPAGVAAQRRHLELLAARDTSYAGAYWRNGFHEDGVVSALKACERLGIGEKLGIAA